MHAARRTPTQTICRSPFRRPHAARSAPSADRARRGPSRSLRAHRGRAVELLAARALLWPARARCSSPTCTSARRRRFAPAACRCRAASTAADLTRLAALVASLRREHGSSCWATFLHAKAGAVPRSIGVHRVARSARRTERCAGARQPRCECRRSARGAGAWTSSPSLRDAAVPRLPRARVAAPPGMRCAATCIRACARAAREESAAAAVLRAGAAARDAAGVRPDHGARDSCLRARARPGRDRGTRTVSACRRTRPLSLPSPPHTGERAISLTFLRSGALQLVPAVRGAFRFLQGLHAVRGAFFIRLPLAASVEAFGRAGRAAVQSRVRRANFR